MRFLGHLTHAARSAGTFVPYPTAQLLGSCGTVSNIPVFRSFFTVDTQWSPRGHGSGAPQSWRESRGPWGPVVADPVPSYEEFRDVARWADRQHNLYTYAADPELMRRHVREGVEYVRENYGKERVVRQWSSLFRDVLG